MARAWIGSLRVSSKTSAAALTASSTSVSEGDATVATTSPSYGLFTSKVSEPPRHSPATRNFFVPVISVVPSDVEKARSDVLQLTQNGQASMLDMTCLIRV